MKDSFNVGSFTEIISNVTSKSANIQDSITKISSYIEKLMFLIGNQENPALYQGWSELKQQIDKLSQKYVERNKMFLSELSNYKELTLINNDELYQWIQQAIQQVSSLSSQIDGL